MNEQAPKARFITGLMIQFMVFLLVFAGLAVAGEFNWVDQVLARRGVSALLGVLLVLCGNALPKLTTRIDRDTPTLAKADRAAGRLLILTGIGFALCWLALPLELARSVSPVLGLAGGLLAVVSWVWTARSASEGATRLFQSSSATAVRLAVMMIGGSIIATFGLFEIDRQLGDAAAQWSAIIFVLVIGFVAALPAVRAATARR